MIGAILGDIVGSIYEFDNIKTKEFELFDKECFFTDNSVMAIAIAEALMQYDTIDFTIDEIRPFYDYDITCQGTVPQAMQAFFESDSFEDAIRNAISIGGDSDTLAAITGAVAESYYGIPDDLKETALSYLDDRLLDITEKFEEKYIG